MFRPYIILPVITRRRAVNLLATSSHTSPHPPALTGKHAVLGPVSALPAGSAVPPEQVVQPQMQWPGSGELSVRVVTDGPTRVLQVTDTNSTYRVRIYTRHQQHTQGMFSRPAEQCPTICRFEWEMTPDSQ